MGERAVYEPRLVSGNTFLILILTLAKSGLTLAWYRKARHQRRFDAPLVAAGFAVATVAVFAAIGDSDLRIAACACGLVLFWSGATVRHAGWLQSVLAYERPRQLWLIVRLLRRSG